MFAATFREMDILLKSNRAILKEVGNLISNPAYELLKNDSEIRKGITFPVGTIRTWRGKKYIKTAPGKWERKYDEGSEKFDKNSDYTDPKNDKINESTNKKTGYTAKLRKNLEENLRPFFNKPILNKNTNIKAFLSKKSVEKIGSAKAIEKSKNNGFTVKQHFVVANNIITLFENSSLVSSTPDNKGNKNLLSIKRFSITTILENKEKAHVYITVKESVEKGHRIYSVEVMDIKKRL